MTLCNEQRESAQQRYARAHCCECPNIMDVPLLRLRLCDAADEPCPNAAPYSGPLSRGLRSGDTGGKPLEPAGASRVFTDKCDGVAGAGPVRDDAESVRQAADGQAKATGSLPEVCAASALSLLSKELVRADARAPSRSTKRLGRGEADPEGAAAGTAPVGAESWIRICGELSSWRCRAASSSSSRSAASRNRWYESPASALASGSEPPLSCRSKSGRSLIGDKALAIDGDSLPPDIALGSATKR